VPKVRSFTPLLFLKPLFIFGYRVFPPSRNLARYQQDFGKYPNVIRPKTINEKVQRKILFDRNPRLALFSDKLAVRRYVRSRLGDDSCLPKLYGVVESGAGIRELRLPSKFVMKPTHLSGSVKFVQDISTVPPGELEALARDWLKTNFFDVTYEWGYKNVRPGVIFEEMLEVDGQLAPDYKFFCFGGEPRFFYIVRERVKKPKINFYDMNMSRLPVRLKLYENFSEEISAPPNFDMMVEVARKLSSGVDFVRVDMYNVDGRVVFGEMTNYNGNGRMRFVPPAWDEKFGSYWK